MYVATYFVINDYRNPKPRLRPVFDAVLDTISHPSHVIFRWFEEDKQEAGPQCDVLGAPLEASHKLYLDLQNVYKRNT